MFTISCVSIHIKSGSVFQFLMNYYVLYMYIGKKLCLAKKVIFNLIKVLMNTERVRSRSILLEHFANWQHLSGVSKMTGYTFNSKP